MPWQLLVQLTCSKPVVLIQFMTNLIVGGPNDRGSSNVVIVFALIIRILIFRQDLPFKRALARAWWESRRPVVAFLLGEKLG